MQAPTAGCVLLVAAAWTHRGHVFGGQRVFCCCTTSPSSIISCQPNKSKRPTARRVGSRHSCVFHRTCQIQQHSDTAQQLQAKGSQANGFKHWPDGQRALRHTLPRHQHTHSRHKPPTHLHNMLTSLHPHVTFHCLCSILYTDNTSHTHRHTDTGRHALSWQCLCVLQVPHLPRAGSAPCRFVPLARMYAVYHDLAAECAAKRDHVPLSRHALYKHFSADDQTAASKANKGCLFIASRPPLIIITASDTGACSNTACVPQACLPPPYHAAIAVELAVCCRCTVVAAAAMHASRIHTPRTCVPASQGWW